MPSSLTDTMNQQQKDAILHFKSPLLIVAGAGSGKTRVITHKIAYLIKEKHYLPSSILGVTFTNKAASEMKERISALTGIGPENFHLSTFHSLGLRILRENAVHAGFSRDWKIIDDGEQKKIIEQLIKTNSSHYTNEMREQIRKGINFAKMNGCYPNNPDFLRQRGMRELAIKIFKLYYKYQMENRLWDYEDLISLPVKLLRNSPEICRIYSERYHYIVVDEFQDTNPNQYELVHLLARDRQAITVVGDDDQAIYSWRGASIRFLSRYEKDFPGTRIIKLEQNFRSTGPILNFANALIESNLQRKGKSMWTEKKTGKTVTVLHSQSKEDEAEKITSLIERWKRTRPEMLPAAILYRINSQSLAFETTFAKRDISFRILKGQRFFDRKEIKDSLAMLRLAIDPRDNLAFLRVIDFLPLGIGAKTLEQISSIAETDSIPLMDALTRGLPEKISSRPFLIELARIHREGCDSKVSELLRQLLKISGYRDTLADKREESRLLNLDELVTFLEKWEQSSVNQSVEELLDQVALDGVTEKQGPAVDAYLLTMHNAKGLEFKTVIVSGINASYMPFFLRKDPSEKEEERRLFYVAATRAIEQLIISDGSMKSSPFLAAIPGSLYSNAYSVEDLFENQSGRSVLRNAGVPKNDRFLEHPVFGTGKIEKNLDKHKFLVLFPDRGSKVIDTSIVQVNFL